MRTRRLELLPPPDSAPTLSGVQATTEEVRVDAARTGELPVLFWRRGCPYCLRLKAGLRLRRVTYRAVDVWEDPAAAEEVRAANGGDELVPTVRVGSLYLSNPSVAQVQAALATRHR